MMSALAPHHSPCHRCNHKMDCDQSKARQGKAKHEQGAVPHGTWVERWKDHLSAVGWITLHPLELSWAGDHERPVGDAATRSHATMRSPLRSLLVVVALTHDSLRILAVRVELAGPQTSTSRAPQVVVGEAKQVPGFRVPWRWPLEVNRVDCVQQVVRLAGVSVGVHECTTTCSHRGHT